MTDAPQTPEPIEPSPLVEPIGTDTAEPPTSKKPRARMTRSAVVWMMGLSAAFMVGTIVFTGITIVQYRAATEAKSVAAKSERAVEVKKSEQDDAKEAAAEAAAAAAQEIADQKASADQVARSAGFEISPTADGLVFYKNVDGDCSTSFMGCAHVAIAVSTACASGVYVAARLVNSDEVVVGNGNAITGALDPEHPTVVEIPFPNAQGTAATYEITDAHCLLN